MNIDLTQAQIRILGCLIEKQLTTPDYYPLTLSALTNACNQKSNREPVMNLSESNVLDEIQGLIGHNLAREQQISGARVLKYAHKLSDTLTKEYDFSQNELGVLSILFVRGPQTVGEIRTRTNRMCDFSSLSAVESCLQDLIKKDGGPYVAQMAKAPGRREIRYRQLFSASANDSPLATQQATSSLSELDELRSEVSALRTELEALKNIVNLKLAGN